LIGPRKASPLSQDPGKPLYVAVSLTVCRFAVIGKQVRAGVYLLAATAYCAGRWGRRAEDLVAVLDWFNRYMLRLGTLTNAKPNR